MGDNKRVTNTNLSDNVLLEFFLNDKYNQINIPMNYFFTLFQINWYKNIRDHVDKS